MTAFFIACGCAILPSVMAIKKQTRKSPPRMAPRKKKPKREITGFSTMNQVSGVPDVREYHSSLPVDEPKSVVEPGVSCELCGQRIETIASCMTTAIGGYAHFDCVLEHIRQLEHIDESETLSYIGSGNFGVIAKDQDGKLHIRKTIQWESPERLSSMKAYIAELKK